MLLASSPLLGLTVLAPAHADPATEHLRIEPAPAGTDDHFGESIALTDSFLVIGIPNYDGFGTNMGMVSVIFPDPTTGLPSSTTQFIPVSMLNAQANFGQVVAADGDTFAVSAPHAVDGAMNRVGKIFVCRVTAGSIAIEATLQPAGLATADMFGYDLDLVGDTLVVGAPGTNGNEGSVWVYKRTINDWDSGLEIQCPHGEEGNKFGFSVALNHEDESKMAVAAPWDSDAGTDAGRVFYFEKPSTAWTLRAEIDQTDLGVLTEQLGYDLDYDGDHLAIGEPAWQNIHMMEWTGSTPLWDHQDTVYAVTSAVTLDFGAQIALDEDLLAAGAAGADLNGTDSGAAYLFSHVSGDWVQVAELEDSLGDANWEMGQGIAMLGDILLIGTTGAESNSVANAGTVLGFDVSSTPGCPSDVVMTGEVDDDDVLELLSTWGPCGGSACPGDHNEDHMIDIVDLLILVSEWGSCS